MKIKLKRNERVVKVFADSGICVTWNMLHEESTRWGAWIQRNEIKRLGICMGNRPEFLYSLIGALRAGVPVVLIPLAGDFSVPACTQIFDDADAHITRCDGIALSAVDLPNADAPVIEYDWQENETILIVPTSGTSGVRKWQEKSLNAYFNPSIGLLFRIVSKLPLSVFNASPWYHNAGIYLVLQFIIGTEVPEITIKSFHPGKVQEAFQKYRPTIWVGTPTMLYRACTYSSNPTAPIPRLVIASGEAVRAHMMKAYSKCAGFSVLLQTYGTTETGPIAGQICVTERTTLFSFIISHILRFTGIAQHIYHCDEIEKGFAGEVHKDVQVVIQNPGADGIGSITVQSNTMATGLEGTFFDTGDIGYLDGCKLYITGRNTNVINHSGEKIMPDDVESCIRTVQGVRDVFVFGIPSDTHGEDVCIAVEGSLSYEDAYEKLPKFMWPKRILCVENFPLNESGKIDQKKLKDMVLQ